MQTGSSDSNSAVLKYLSEKDISSEIDMFNSGKELLGLGTDLLGYNIIFLDINMDEIDGIMTAHKIREYSMDIYIVFVTAYDCFLLGTL